MKFFDCLKYAYKIFALVVLLLAGLFGPVLIATTLDKLWIFLFSFITVPLTCAAVMYFGKKLD